MLESIFGVFVTVGVLVGAPVFVGKGVFDGLGVLVGIAAFVAAFFVEIALPDLVLLIKKDAPMQKISKPTRESNTIATIFSGDFFFARMIGGGT
jgi:hypothetical protein